MTQPQTKAGAIRTVVLQHIFAVAVSTAGAAVAGWGPPSVGIWAEPLLFTAIAVAMAYCSLSAIWWARTTWSSHLKTLAAVAACVATLVFLLAALTQSRSDPQRAAGWAASFASQASLTAIAATLLELGIPAKWSATKNRFSISFLLIWTTVIACVLGGSRWLVARYDVTPESLFTWQFFPQLQAVAVANSILAISVLACVRLAKDSRMSVWCCVVVIPSISGIAAVCMFALFGNKFGVPPLEFAWLSIAQGTILVATLVPLEFVVQKTIATHKM